jgi:hypothetical protein
MYNISEGNPILNSEGWAPQQRLGLNTDTNMPSELEANAYTRDSVTESLVGSKQVEHKPVVYSLPKNTTLEGQQKLESIVDVGRLQVCVVSHNCFYYTSNPECVIPDDKLLYLHEYTEACTGILGIVCLNCILEILHVTLVGTT